MGIGDFISFLKGKESKVFLDVREGRYGIETYINPILTSLEPSYKKQLVAFLEGVIKTLGGKNA